MIRPSRFEKSLLYPSEMTNPALGAQNGSGRPTNTARPRRDALSQGACPIPDPNGQALLEGKDNSREERIRSAERYDNSNTRNNIVVPDEATTGDDTVPFLSLGDLVDGFEVDSIDYTKNKIIAEAEQREQDKNHCAHHCQHRVCSKVRPMLTIENEKCICTTAQYDTIPFPNLEDPFDGLEEDLFDYTKNKAIAEAQQKEQDKYHCALHCQHRICLGVRPSLDLDNLKCIGIAPVSPTQRPPLNDADYKFITRNKLSHVDHSTITVQRFDCYAYFAYIINRRPPTHAFYKHDFELHMNAYFKRSIDTQGSLYREITPKKLMQELEATMAGALVDVVKRYGKSVYDGIPKLTFDSPMYVAGEARKKGLEWEELWKQWMEACEHLVAILHWMSQGLEF